MTDKTFRSRDREGSPPLLEARRVSKTFGDLQANNAVSLRIFPREIHALLGENGAGKSTLVKIFYGALAPDAGALFWRGRPVAIRDPAAARALGIGMVFQHFSLFEALSVTENIALALPRATPTRQLMERIAAVSEAYGLPLDPRATIADLSVGVRQRVEIVRVLLQEPRLVIMDEPTSVLTPQEADRLFETLQRLVGEGRAILYISHRLEEVQRIAHRATILRRGRVTATCDPKQETAASLARRMVGAEVVAARAPAEASPGAVRLKLDALSLPAAHPFATALRDISLEVHGGEIVAIAGVAGNGQGELFDAVSGERLGPQAETVKINGLPVGMAGITRRRRAGAAFVPEERLGHAALPSLRLSGNLLLTRHATDARLVRGGFVDGKAVRAQSAQVVERYDVRASDIDLEAHALSGGNLQKFVIGRELDRNPSVLVVNQPTWGVDAGAAAVIRQELIDRARAGAAVLVISQDLDEIFEIADRIAVIVRGRLSPTVETGNMTRERVGLLMGGAISVHSTEGPIHAT